MSNTTTIIFPKLILDLLTKIGYVAYLITRLRERYETINIQIEENNLNEDITRNIQEVDDIYEDYAYCYGDSRDFEDYNELYEEYNPGE